MSNRRVEVIANGIDAAQFAPGDRGKARAALALAERDRAILVFAEGNTADVRKGVWTIGPAIAALNPSERSRIRLLVVGAGSIGGLPGDVVVRRIPPAQREKELIEIYQAADAHALPTLQDNLPNTAIEAMACGCPVLAFATGGVAEFVVPGENGDLAREATTTAFSEVLRRWVSQTADQHRQLAAGARRTFLQRFELHARCADYVRLYRSLVPAPS